MRQKAKGAVTNLQQARANNSSVFSSPSSLVHFFKFDETTGTTHADNIGGVTYTPSPTNTYDSDLKAWLTQDDDQLDIGGDWIDIADTTDFLMIWSARSNLTGSPIAGGMRQGYGVFDDAHLQFGGNIAGTSTYFLQDTALNSASVTLSAIPNDDTTDYGFILAADQSGNMTALRVDFTRGTETSGTADMTVLTTIVLSNAANKKFRCYGAKTYGTCLLVYPNNTLPSNWKALAVETADMWRLGYKGFIAPGL